MSDAISRKLAESLAEWLDFLERCRFSCVYVGDYWRSKFRPGHRAAA